MPIYHDPTEERKFTRLPEAVIRQSHSIPGLEALTGADLIISPSALPTTDLRQLAGDTMTGSASHLLWRGYEPRQVARMVERTLPFVLTTQKVKESCKHGMLVQRKSGRDLSSSVPRLSEILLKMLDWSPRAWLLFVGDLKCDSKGQTVIDGFDTGFSHNAVQGALDAWQERGGFITFLSRDALIAPWISRQLDRLRTVPEERIEEVRQPVQSLSGGSERGWLTTLTTFPNVGADKARLLGDYYGTLAGCLEFLSDQDSALLENRPKGFGAVTIQEARAWLGLDDPCLRLVVEMEKKK